MILDSFPSKLIRSSKDFPAENVEKTVTFSKKLNIFMNIADFIILGLEIESLCPVGHFQTIKHFGLEKASKWILEFYAIFLQNGPPRGIFVQNGTHRCADLPFCLQLFRRLALSLSPPCAGAGQCGIGKLHNFVFLRLQKTPLFHFLRKVFYLIVPSFLVHATAPLLPHFYPTFIGCRQGLLGFKEIVLSPLLTTLLFVPLPTSLFAYMLANNHRFLRTKKPRARDLLFCRIQILFLMFF